MIQQLTQSTEATLVQQKEAILKEFSLDNGEGALTRLVTELKTKHGEVGDALDKRISEVTGEFSLDNEDSALSRLMQGVEKAQRQISSEFDLNEDGSALARMQKKLLEEIEKQNKANTDFQTEVKTALAEMKARKQESERGTRHGLVFEDAVFGFVSERSQGAADIAERTGNTTGLIKNNKKGDVVIELGPEAASAGARIVVEAKEDASYNLKKALEEMEEARKNRGAGIGVFVFSKRTAPSGLEVFNRYGNDVVVIWDAEDTGSDVFLDAGLSVARALCARPKSISEEIDADFEALEKAILEIGRQAEGLDDITKSSETIRSSTDRVVERARIMKGRSEQANRHPERKGGWPERGDGQPCLIPGCDDLCGCSCSSAQFGKLPPNSSWLRDVISCGRFLFCHSSFDWSRGFHQGLFSRLSRWAFRVSPVGFRAVWFLHRGSLGAMGGFRREGEC